MDDNKKLYDNFLKSGKITEKEIGDFETFNTLVTDSNNASKLYDNLRKNDLFKEDELGDKNTFITLTTGKGTPQSQIIIPGKTIAYSHNNPGNIMFADQPGAVRGEPKKGGGYWAKFESPEIGFKAVVGYVDRIKRGETKHGLSSNSTVRDFFNIYAPPSENDTETYVKSVSNSLGVTPETKIGEIDSTKFAKEIVKYESGTRITGEQKEEPKIEKIQWADDPKIEELKNKGFVSAWTSPYNYDKFLTKQKNEDVDGINSDVQSFTAKGKEINQKFKQQVDDFDKQQNADIEKLNSDYQNKEKKLSEAANKRIASAETETEQKKIIAEYKATAEREHADYVSAYDKKVKDINDQRQKIADSEKNEIDKLNSDIKKYGDQKDKESAQPNIKTKFIGQGDVTNIQTAIASAPEGYEEKKKYVEKLANDFTDKIVYTSKEDPDSVKNEVYAVINQKLLFDSDGKVSSYSLKNQAEIAKQSLSSDFNRVSAEYQKIINKPAKPLTAANVQFNQFVPQYTPEEQNVITQYNIYTKAIENYDRILKLPDDNKGKEKKANVSPMGKGVVTGGAGSFGSGWVQDPNWLANVVGVGIPNLMQTLGEYKISQKSQRGEKLTPAEQKLLDSSMLLVATTEKLSPGFSTAYDVGSAVSNSLAWVTSMIVSGGIYGITKSATLKALGWQAGKYTLGNISKTLTGEAVGALARLPIQASFYADVYKGRTNVKPVTGKYTGTIKGEGFAPESSWGKSIGNAAWKGWVENISEVSGGYMSLAGNKVLQNISKKYGLEVLNRISKTNLAKGFGWMSDKAKLSGPISEYLEEKVADVLHLVDGSSDLKSIVNPHQNWVTFLSVATMVAPMHVLSLGAKAKGDITDFLNKDQQEELSKILKLNNVEVKGKALTKFIFDNEIEEPTQQDIVARHVWDTQQAQVSQELVKPEEEITGETPRYSHNEIEIDENNINELIDNASSASDLKGIGIFNNDKMKGKLATRYEYLESVEREEKEFTKGLEQAGTDQVKIKEVEKQHRKNVSTIESDYEQKRQKYETVKPESEIIITDINTDLSDIQPIEIQEVPKSEQKNVPVKGKIFKKFTKTLGITNENVPIESGRQGKIGSVNVILSEGQNENEVVIESIKTPKIARNKGKAGKVLKRILSEADNNGVTLKLKAKPEKGSDMTQQQLIDWYKRNGFEFAEGSIEGIRKPKKPKPKKSKLAQDMEDQYNEFSKNAKSALPFEVIDDESQIPEHILNNPLVKQSKGKGIQAFFDPQTNTIYFIAKNIPKDKIVSKWIHEQGIHRGLEVLIPDKTKREILLKKVFDSVGIDKIKSSIPKVYGDAFDSGKISETGIAEEYLAFLAEKILTEKDLTKEEKSIWEKFKKWLNDILKPIYGNVKLTDSEIADIVKASVKSIYTEKSKEKGKEGKFSTITDYIENNNTEIFSQLKAKGIIKVKGEC